MLISNNKKEISRARFRAAGASGRKLHVMFREGNWVVYREGSEKIISEYDTKKMLFAMVKEY